MTEHSFVFNKKSVAAAACSVVLAVGLAVPATFAFAEPTAASKQAEAAAALEKLNSLNAQMEEASGNYQSALEDQMQAQSKINEAQATIDEETVKMQGYQEKLGDRARSMYRSGGETFLDVILGASTFEEFATNWNILETLNNKDAELVQEAKDSREKLEAAKAEYVEQERVAAEKAEEARVVAENAEATAAEMQSVYNNLSAEAQELVAQEEAAQEAAQAADAADRVENGNVNEGVDGGSSDNGGSSYDPPQSVSGNAVVDRAYSKLGSPYAWSATGPNSFDCSGFVGYCLTGSTGRLGTTETFMGWPQVSNPQPGDVVTTWTHCGIYIGGGMMIHAPQTGDVVKISPVRSNMIYVRY